MNAPLSNDRGPAVKPTRQQLEAARVRSRTTGEPLEHVLAVFLGGGRDGSAVPVCADYGDAGAPERLAAVLPFPGADRGTSGQGDAGE